MKPLAGVHNLPVPGVKESNVKNQESRVKIQKNVKNQESRVKIQNSRVKSQESGVMGKQYLYI